MDLATIFNIFPPEIATLLIAMLPVAELRGSIPIALTIYDLSIPVAYILSVVGNIIPAFFILWLLGPLSGYLIERFSWANKFFDWLFDRTKHKFSGKYEKWGMFALTLFVAIPLPVTGVWTGSVAAFIFGIPKKTSLALITLGALIAGVIVTSLTLGIITIF
ncbi:MAG: ligand-binding protein SH3 [Parcubacteria group bacterium]|nr:ligand-binding protein SH3 [Parcubacteria group bacterium]|tara:strand:- start:1710 stop:2195 length:486 start_codon:yes stop_codon:yes gene_type:complete